VDRQRAAIRPAGAGPVRSRHLHLEPPALVAAAASAAAAVAVALDHLVPGSWAGQPLFVYAAVAAFTVAAVTALQAPSRRRRGWDRVLIADAAGAGNAVTATVVGDGTGVTLLLIVVGAAVTAAVAVRARTPPSAATADREGRRRPVLG
jgi:hypothetical protein